VPLLAPDEERREENRSTVVEVFADVSCPFAHVGLRRFVQERARRARNDPVLRVRAWPLELVNGTPLDRASVAEHVAALRDQVAPDLFHGFDPSAFPESSLPALALAAAAYDVDDRFGEAVSLALRDALFEAGLDISDGSVLGAIASDLGVEVPQPKVLEAVFGDWEEGKRRGVAGSPEFFVEGRGYFCPTLDITRIAGGVRIVRDLEGFELFLTACFEN